MPHKFYTLWSKVYDPAVRPFIGSFRSEAVRALELEPGQRLLICGVGTGLDFPLLPQGLEIEALDLNASMLERARERAAELGLRMDLRLGDAEALPFPDGTFDRAYLPLIACVAEDGRAVVREALRVTKPGGRVVVMDKFWPEGAWKNPLLKLAELVSGSLITHLDRRWSELSSGLAGYRLVADVKGPLWGYFRVLVLEKTP